MPLALALGLIAGEISLQILVRLGLISSHASRYISHMQDDVLRTRLPIGIYPEINSRGYRNDRTPEHVEIVALGDSQTYGYNVASDNAWPKRLQKLTGKYVYNMGIGGYGPAQYYHLLAEALKMTPNYVIFATPLNNDLMETCHIFFMPYWKDFARDRNLDIRHCDFSSRPGSVELGLRHYSEVLMLIKQLPGIGTYFMRSRDLGRARADPENHYVVDDANVSTIININTVGIDQTITHTRVGKRVAEYFFSTMLEEAADAKLIMLFVPSKANVLYDYLLTHRHELPPKYHELVATERALIDEFADWFEQQGGSTIDPTAKLQALVGSDPPLYLDYADSHLTAAGYAAMAQAVFDRYFAAIASHGGPAS